jgi:hypothetical protein
MTTISISGIHNYSNYPFLILKILELYAFTIQLEY